MKNIDVIKAFLDNKDGVGYANTEHVAFQANKLWSYNTVIAEKIKSPIGDRDILLINTTKYSVTTSKHQTYLRRQLEFYVSKYQIEEISHVPINSQHLYNY